MSNSCETCPHRLTPQQQKQEAGWVREMAPGIDACGLHGHALGRPGLDADETVKIWESFGQDCPDHKRPLRDGEQYPKIPVARVAAPYTPALINPETGKPWEPEEDTTAPVSCRQCANFALETVVKDEIGFTLPLCTALGRLITPRQIHVEPKHCGTWRHGQPFESLRGLKLLQQYESAILVNLNSDQGLEDFIAKGGVEFVEPSTYETDAEVTADDKAAGIRAWRKFRNPENSKKTVLVPIFDPDFFDAGQRAMIPTTGDDEHPEWYMDHDGLVFDSLAVMQHFGETPIFVGDAGTGKTELARHLAWIMQLPFTRISLTKTSEVDDLIGKWTVRNQEMIWLDGDLPRDWAKPGVTCLDEAPAAPAEVWQVLRPLTDNSKQLRLSQYDGRVVSRDTFRYLIMTTNPLWDSKYVGLNDLSVADVDRLAVVEFPLPSDKVERKIIAQRCLDNGYRIDAETLDTVMKIAEDLRAASDTKGKGRLPISWGIRPNIKVALMTEMFSLQKAFRRALVDFLDPQARDLIMTIVGTHVGATIDD